MANKKVTLLLKLGLKRGFAANIVIFVILAASLIATIFLLQQRTGFLNRASSDSKLVVRGLADDMWADVVIGKLDFHQAIENRVVPFKVANPGGVIVDRGVKPNRLYVYDGANSRILGYRSLGVCQDNPKTACTTNSDCGASSCNITAQKPADLVIGQPSGWDHSACNIVDGTMENFPNRKPASATSLCSTPPSQNSPLEGGTEASMAIDQDHNLYVPDYHNNRVLKYLNPFETDTVADEVWGQDNFTGFRCNKTDSDYSGSANAPQKPKPTASSLCFGRNQKYQAPSFSAGVDIDPDGSLWVADNWNNRVLRFPKGSKTANLVLGQPDFTSNEWGNSVTGLNSPSVVRVNPQTKEIFVADYENDRILVFKAPFQNGMAADRTFGKNFDAPAGIEFDPNGSGVWVSDHNNNMTELWDNSGTNVLKVLRKDTYQPNGVCGSVTANKSCINPQTGGACWENLCLTRGSIGIDSEDNIYLTGKFWAQDVYRYSAPIPNPIEGKLYSADKRLMSPPEGGANLVGANSLYAPQGIEVTDNQLIIADEKRLIFWNDLSSFSNGKRADGAVNKLTETDNQGYHRIAADKVGHLYVLRGSGIEMYNLPLTNGAKPLKVIKEETSIPVLGGGSISWPYNQRLDGIDVSKDGKYLWFTEVAGGVHRVMRMRDPLGNATIDVILGHASINETSCNRNPDNESQIGGNPSGAAPNTLCMPGSVVLDQHENVWVSDYALESNGNRRLLMFKKEQFDNLTTTLFGPNADLVSPEIRAWQPAFDSDNHMIIGIDGQTNPPGFPKIFLNPLETLANSVAPDMELNDFFSHGYSSAFDANDNLYITDMNRGRVLIYRHPIAMVKNEKPIAKFEISPRNGQSPLTVKFTNNSSDPDNDPLTYKWDFGDKQSSTEKNPKHTFVSYSSKANTITDFWTTLTVTDNKGASTTKTKKISVRAEKPFQYNFNYTTKKLSANRFELRFSPVVPGELKDFTYQWDFGDGKIGKARLPQHTYQKKGSYKVTLTITGKSAESTTQVIEKVIVLK